jgi:hypothetical protein
MLVTLPERDSIVSTLRLLLISPSVTWQITELSDNQRVASPFDAPTRSLKL